MRVLYDYQAFQQRYGGVSRYFAELQRALAETGGVEVVMPIPYSDNCYLDRRRVLLTRRPIKGKGRIMEALNQAAARRALRGDYDLFHPTYYRPYFLGRLRRPFVITVHDMIHETVHGAGLRDDGSAEHKRALCASAARIIAVSQSTRADLCAILGVPESRVDVVYHATTLAYDGRPRQYREPYLLYVGQRGGYKNFPVFTEAVAPLLCREGVHLLCVGGGGFSAAERGLLARLKIDARVAQLEVASQSELAGLYHFASCFCYPSLYEGFGLPLLEAFACGCPVAAGSCPSSVEVAGGAAEHFAAAAPDSIRAAVQRVLGDAARARDLVAAGFRRVQDFTWEASARATLAVYRAAVSG